ncbi:SOCS7 family protein [Megaselia abdita]
MMDFRQGSSNLTEQQQQIQQYAAATANLLNLNLGNAQTNLENLNFCLIPHHEQISANSLELNAVTSLSDDSGIPQTNSSISSGDSYKLGICKFEMGLAESDGEVSQFDSLDNCSEGGMSGENFNTLKKVPMAPIDPPPEFQDSPQTTLVRAKALQQHRNHTTITPNGSLTKQLPRWSSQSSLQNQSVKEMDSNITDAQDDIHSYDEYDTSTLSSSKVATIRPNYNFPFHSSGLKDSYNRHLHSSDSILNRYAANCLDSDDNLYDDPTDILSSSMGNCIDQREESFSSSPATPPSATTAPKKVPMCPYYADHTRYFKAIKPETDSKQQQHQQFQRYNLVDMIDTPASIQDIAKFNAKDYTYKPPVKNSSSSSHHKARKNKRRKRHQHQEKSVVTNNNSTTTVTTTTAVVASNNNNNNNNNLNYNTTEESNSEIDKFFSKHNKIYHHHRKGFGGRPIFNYSEGGSATDSPSVSEPLHMSLDEVKQFYHTIYSDTDKGAAEHNNNVVSKVKSQEIGQQKINQSTNTTATITRTISIKPVNNNQKSSCKATTDVGGGKAATQITSSSSGHDSKKSQFTFNLKQRFCSLFRFRNKNRNSRINSTDSSSEYLLQQSSNKSSFLSAEDKRKKFQSRALPPLPNKSNKESNAGTEEPTKESNSRNTEGGRALQFTSSIEKVKDYGWYWGPLSSESAEKVLSNEPDGSFIVRDSSDDHYIFSLSFKLNNLVRHVRIEQDQGTFSFGSYAKFKSETITEFIEKAVDHSRSGRYLFFLHRRPEHGPMRVQLTNPVSRFKHIQSLQHMCRFVILKTVVRKDLIGTLPLPRRLLDYLNYKHYYSEQIESDSSQSQMSGDGRV